MTIKINKKTILTIKKTEYITKADKKKSYLLITERCLAYLDY